MMEATTAKVPFPTNEVAPIPSHMIVRVEPWTNSELVIICIKQIYICQNAH